MPEEHERNDPAEVKQKIDSINRRRFLKSLSTVGVGASIIGTSRGASTPPTSSAEEIHITEMEGEERRRTLQEAITDTKLKRIRNNIISNNNSIQYTNIRVMAVNPEYSESYLYVFIPFNDDTESNSNLKNNNSALTWKTSLDNKQSSSLVSGYKYNKNIIKNGSLAEVEVNTYSVMDETVEQIETESKILTSSQPYAEVPMPPVSGHDCMMIDTYCVDFNMSCIMFLGGSLGLGCMKGGPIACVITAFLEGGAYITGDGCKICDERTQEAKRKPMCGCPACE